MLNVASFMEIDDLIDPLETRRWIMQGLRSVPLSIPTEGKRRPFIDTWGIVRLLAKRYRYIIAYQYRISQKGYGGLSATGRATAPYGIIESMS
jgi:hypothetical protein